MRVASRSSACVVFWAVLGSALLGLLSVSGSAEQGDGYGSPEWVAGFGAADADGDGLLTEQETTAARRWAELLVNVDFALADANGDGELSRSEFEQYACQLMAYGVGRADPETDAQLAELLSLDAFLAALAHREAYRDEVSALLEALTEAGDDDIGRVRYIIGHPDKYPKVAPLVTRWAWRHPARRAWLPRAISPRRPYVKPGASARPRRAGTKAPRRGPGAVSPPRSTPKPPRATKPRRRPR